MREGEEKGKKGEGEGRGGADRGEERDRGRRKRHGQNVGQDCAENITFNKV